MDATQALAHDEVAGASKGPVARVSLVSRDPAIRDRLTAAVRSTGLVLERAVESVADIPAGVRPEAVLLGPVAIKHDGVRAARAGFPDALLIAVLEDSARHRVRTALDEGADGIVVFAEVEETLAVTLEAARVGQLAVPKAVRTTMARPVLSTREKQVLGMVVLGFSNAEIARKLVLSESTIKSHLSSSFHKLGVRSRAEAAAMILDTNAGMGTGILAISEDS
jgi:DNA-binding NarL/FixJ family response regulator